MHKLALILLLVGFSLPAVAAQDEEANLEAFGGYSYLHFDLKGAQASSSHLNGFNVAVTANINRHFGLTGDFSAHFGGFRYGFDSAHDFSVLAGATPAFGISPIFALRACPGRSDAVQPDFQRDPAGAGCILDRIHLRFGRRSGLPAFARFLCPRGASGLHAGSPVQHQS